MGHLGLSFSALPETRSLKSIKNKVAKVRANSSSYYKEELITFKSYIIHEVYKLLSLNLKILS